MLNGLQKISGISLPRITSVLIICGDCAGDELLPVWTNLTSDGRCAVCGGRSFISASRRCDAYSRHLLEQKNERGK